MDSKIYPLALPKGTEKLCELCSKRAYLQCPKCRVTFYCNESHQQADWVGIHKRICQLLTYIRSETMMSFHPENHVELQLQREELIEICRLVAESKLSEGKHQEALPAAQFYLRCSKDVYGPAVVELVPAYLLLADANIGMNNLSLVAELLSQAEWAVLKTPDCGYAVHQRLHRSLGRLHTITGELDAALFDFGNDIYFASEEYGLDSVVTCGGYFLMADVFVKMDNMAVAHSLYSEVTRIWHLYLTKLVQTQIEKAQDPDGVSEPSYDTVQRVEVDMMLRTVLEFKQNESAQIVLVTHCLAMLWFLEGDHKKVKRWDFAAQLWRPVS
ncbi:zinc finger MYND domain-containing protein 12 isoform X2 [Nelusetta ayraudi]|uniref:zinc finger MYND domain-containing protein 12 isoform X2 n=1 Tax=Nelusetta ayraudi TaxID=303726 RepID=UPI003F70E98F